MNRKVLLGIFATIAAALPQITAALPEMLPHLVTPVQATALLSVLSGIGAIVTGVLKFTDTKDGK